MTVDAIIHQLAIIQATLPGVKSAYEYVAESAAALPCFINYPDSGEFKSVGAAGCITQDIHVVGCDYFVSRGNLPSAERLARPIIEQFRAAIAADPTLGGNCKNALYGAMTYEYLVTKFGGQEVLSVMFRLTCLA